MPVEGNLQSSVFGVTSLFIYISYNIKAKSVSLCVCVLVCVAAGEEIDIHDALADTMSLNDWVNFFANDDNDSDFNPLLDLELYDEHMHEESIIGSKIVLDLSEGRLTLEYIQ